jgi:hypothetical protein
MLAGWSFYLWMPIAGMSTPPMQWGYPRTVEGFIHALTRGQYEKANPSDLMSVEGWGRYMTQLWQMVEGVADEFNWIYLLIALIPFLFFFKMQKRERAWVIGIFSIYLCLGPLIVVLFNPAMDRQSRDLLKVFFTASHVLVAMGVGYGLTLIAASMAANYQRFRIWGIVGAAFAAVIALLSLNASASTLFSTGGKTGSLFDLFSQPRTIRAAYHRLPDFDRTGDPFPDEHRSPTGTPRHGGRARRFHTHAGLLLFIALGRQ